MNHRQLLMAYSVSALYFLPCTQHATAASFLPLGDLPGGNFSSYAYDISADGAVVVGGSCVTGNCIQLHHPEFEAFRWTREGGMIGLGTLQGNISSFATGISADGSVVVGSSSRGFVQDEAFRWTNEGGMVGLGIMPGNSSSFASAVSADGSIIVGGQHNGFYGGDFPAFRWTYESGLVDLGDLPGGFGNSSAIDISLDGSVVVGRSSTSRNNTGYSEAFRWTSDGGMVGIGNLPGGEFRSQASAVSADGSVIVGYSEIGHNFEGIEAFRWTNSDGMVGLGDLLGGTHASYAEDVSGDGSIVVGWGSSIIGREAFVWDATNGMRSLSAVLADLDVDLTGWTLTSANAISADGTTVVGHGINPLGQTEAWLANIGTVPEPNGFLLMSFALAAILAMRHAKLLPRGVRQVAVSFVLSVNLAGIAPAQIYRWDNGNVIPGTEGITPGPGMQLANSKLEFAELLNLDLSSARFDYSELANARLGGSNLTNAKFIGANLRRASLASTTLTGADFTNAEIAGAYLDRTTFNGFTSDQFYSTASYRAKQLQGISFLFNNLTEWNFNGQNLTGSTLALVTLTNADFTDATITGTVLAGAPGAGFTKEQLYSTASYQKKNLRGISLSAILVWFGLQSDLSDWDFREQDLSGAAFIQARLSGTDFTGSSLINVTFGTPDQPVPDGYLTGVDLTAADLRGSIGMQLSQAITRNSILPNGRIDGFELLAGERIVIRDDDGVPATPPQSWLSPRAPIPVTIEDHMTLAEGSKLQLVFDADPWDSVIAFEPRIRADFFGTLELTFADDVDVRSQIGRTLKIFDWTWAFRSFGRQFDIQSPYDWDTTNLYTTGEVTLLAVPEPAANVLIVIACTMAFTRRWCGGTSCQIE